MFYLIRCFIWSSPYLGHQISHNSVYTLPTNSILEIPILNESPRRTSSSGTHGTHKTALTVLENRITSRQQTHKTDPFWDIIQIRCMNTTWFQEPDPDSPLATVHSMLTSHKWPDTPSILLEIKSTMPGCLTWTKMAWPECLCRKEVSCGFFYVCNF